MRFDKQVFICDYCKKRVVRNKDDSNFNTKTLNVFEVQPYCTQIEDEEFCSEECMIGRLHGLIQECIFVGASPNFKILNYKYEYEEEEVNE